MGAKINIAYDQDVISENEIAELTKYLPAIVAEAIGEKDVFLYVDNPSKIVDADPIEIFVQVNINKIDDPEKLSELIAVKIGAWKSEIGFMPRPNFNVMPVVWYSKVGI